MLAIHWTPVNNTKKIVKNGIRKSPNGLYCFPLTGDKSLDKWWVSFLNYTSRGKKQYNGIVFRIQESDMPAYFGHWGGATNRDTFDKEIKTLSELKLEFREAILWRMGDQLAHQKGIELPLCWQEANKILLNLAEEALSTNSFFMKDKNLNAFALEDYQIVLSHSIPAQRIVKIMPAQNEFGKVLKKQKMRKFNVKNHLY